MQINGFSRWGKICDALRRMLFLVLVLFAPHAYSASKTILVLGDSLSAEYGIARSSGWVSLLEARLHAEKIAATVVNASISGETTSGGITRLPALLKKHAPDLVIIELGANDGLRGLPFASIEANLHAMISAAKNANARVLLVGMKLPPNYGNDYTEKFHAMFAKVAQASKVPLVPFFLNGVAARDDMFQPDRLHPTAAAQPIMLDNVWPSLKTLLLKK